MQAPAEPVWKTQPSTRRPEPRPQDAAPCDLSVIVPIHNEESNIRPLYTELCEVLAGMEASAELIFIDDGSTDQSLPLLVSIAATDTRVTVLELRRNFGQTAAMAAGIQASRGRVLVPMDGDLQNDPHEIPRLLAKLEGPPAYDIVSGWRKDRHDTWLTRRVPSALANALIRYVTGVALHDYGCTLKAYRREVLEEVSLSSELHRFLPALAAWHGAKITEIPVNHRPRVHGRTKYGLGRTSRVLLDLVTVKFLGTYMTKPLYFFGKLGAWVMVLALVFLGVAIGQRFGLFWQPEGLHLNRNVLLTLSALLAFLTVQCLLFGIMAELLVRIYHESQAKPIYRIRRIYRTEPPADSGTPDD